MFSGIECASVALRPLGYEPICFAEIEKFPSAVLAYRHPGVPNVGDMTQHDWSQYRGVCDLVVGGPPCQAFSVAGLRQSLQDHRGNLSLAYAAAINAIDPRWVITENVPGWLSTSDNAFGCFLGALAGSDSPLVPAKGQRWTDAGVVTGPERTAAWRILDAQYFKLAQRRRRVFVVAVRGSGNWACAEALFPVASRLQGNHPPRREKGERVAPTISARTKGGGGLGTDFDCDGGLVSGAVSSKWAKGTGGPAGDGFDASEGGTGRGTPLVPSLYSIMPMNSGKDYKAREAEVAQPVMTSPVGGNQGGDYVVAIRTAQTSANGHGLAEDVARTLDGAQGQAVAIGENIRGEVVEIEIARTLTVDGGKPGQGYPAARIGMAVRRLTPLECERLMGLPDCYTAIPFNGKLAADGPRYRAIGNGMAVPVVRWIGERIKQAGESQR